MDVVSDTEQHRLECEARHWLDLVGARKADVDDLIARIATKRGKSAAEKLRGEMRRQYLIRRGEA